MLKLRTVFIALLTILILVFAVGCEANPAADPDKDPNPAAGVEGETRIVEHALGQTEIKGTPERIITLYQGATDVAIALEITPVGAVESWVQKPVYEYLRDDLEGVAIVGLETQPNLEEIAKLKPDLIIASKLRHEKVYQQLSQIAPTVTHETVFKFKETVELMGKALNKEDQAEKLLADWADRTADFKEKAAAELGSEWPIEVSVLNFRADHARIYVTGFAGDILGELGFIRPESQRKAAEEGNVVLKLTTKESIPSMNADVFFTFIPGGQNAPEAIQQTYDDWTNHPLWHNLDAVKNDRDYIVDDVIWNMGGGIVAANKMLDQIYQHFGLEK